MPGDAISSGFACISRRFSTGLVGSSARKNVQWTFFSENGPEGPRRTGRQAPELSQGKSTWKWRQRRRNCNGVSSQLRFRHFRNTLWCSVIVGESQCNPYVHSKYVNSPLRGLLPNAGVTRAHSPLLQYCLASSLRVGDPELLSPRGRVMDCRKSNNPRLQPP